MELSGFCSGALDVWSFRARGRMLDAPEAAQIVCHVLRLFLLLEMTSYGEANLSILRHGVAG